MNEYYETTCVHCDRKTPVEGVRERQKLLEQIFGRSCLECELRLKDEYGENRCLWSIALKNGIPVTGRRGDCPFLPFEAKKVSLKPVDEIFAKYMTQEEMKEVDDELEREIK